MAQAEADTVDLTQIPQVESQMAKGVIDARERSPHPSYFVQSSGRSVYQP